MALAIDEWPDVIGEVEPQEEYGRLVEAVGELTSAVLDCQMKGLLIPSTTEGLCGFLTSILSTLKKDG